MNCDNLNQPGTDTCHPSFIDFLSHHLDCDCINVTLPPSLPFAILHTHFLTPHRYKKKNIYIGFKRKGKQTYNNEEGSKIREGYSKHVEEEDKSV